jgi:hypothetical protein
MREQMVGWNDQKGSKKTLGRVESDRVEAGELKCGARFSQLSLDADRHTTAPQQCSKLCYFYAGRRVHGWD